MRFDASPEIQRLVYKTVAIDPRMLRTGMVRIGETLSEISKIEGKARWDSQVTRTDMDFPNRRIGSPAVQDGSILMN